MHLIEKINSWLIIALFFFISISTSMGSLISALIFLLWVVHRNFKEQFLQIKSNRVAVASLIFFSIHIIGLLWSSDFDSALEVIRKQWKFLMLPIFMVYVRREHIFIYLNAFLSSIFLSEILSYLVWFDIIDPILKATQTNPAIFMKHIVYNPLLAIAIYIVASRLFFEKREQSTPMLILGFFFLSSMTINMFITGGRSGQFMFFVVIFIIAFQYFKKNLAKTLLATLIASISIFSIAYLTSPLFKDRMQETFESFKQYEYGQYTSLSFRLTHVINGFDIFLNNPFFGVGTGDLEDEINRVYSIKSSGGEAIDKVHNLYTNNPHNNHIMVIIRFGLAGLLSFYWIFFNQIKFSKNIENKELARLGFAIPILFFVVCFGESYLSIHVTSLLFSALSAALYNRCNCEST